MNIRRFLSILIYFLYCNVNLSEQSNILAIFPTCAVSHAILGSTLLKGLAARGHTVTMFSVFPQKTPVENYTDIVPKTDLCEVYYARQPRNYFAQKMTASLRRLRSLLMSTVQLTEAAIADENMQKLLNSNEKFDAVIAQSFYSDALYAIGHHLNAPLIVMSSVGPSMFTDDLLANPKPYAYVPEMITSYPSKMNFIQRVHNTITSIGIDVIKAIIHYPGHEAIRAKYFPNSPDLFTIMKNISLLLVNSHVTMMHPRPLVPNLVEIGGFAVPNPKPLPSDLQLYLDNATDGVIYFSLGSNVKSVDMPEKMRNDIIKTFSRLKQKVLWKWEDDFMPNKPENVMIRKWFPQPDILTHPNIKLFITHGGWGSVTESVQRGVPLIGIPVFADQDRNIDIVVARGLGLRLDLDKITYESFSTTVNEVLNNPSYTTTMKEVSKLFSDREVKPMDRAAYWIEYVIRHKGAPHLRSAALDLNSAQLMLLDVILFLGLIVLSVGLIFVFCVKVCYKKCCGLRKKTIESNKKID